MAADPIGLPWWIIAAGGVLVAGAVAFAIYWFATGRDDQS